MSLNNDYIPSSPHENDQNLGFSNYPSDLCSDPHSSPAPGSSSILGSDDASPSDAHLNKHSQPIPVSTPDPFTGIVDGTFRPSVLIEDDDGYLAMERSLDGKLYYDAFPMDEDIDKSLDVMYEADEFWNTVQGAPLLHGCLAVAINTADDSSYLDNLLIPWPTEPEYWDGFFTLDDPTLRILSQAVISDAAQYDINESDITKAMHPLQPRITKPFKPSLIDYESKQPYFGWLPLETVKRTFQHCTQHMRLPPSTHLQKRFKSMNPGANLIHRHKADATDLIFCDTPAIDGGETMAHIFVGVVSRLTDVFKAKTRGAETFLGALQDRVWIQGAPTKLLTDNAGMYQSWRITWYLYDIWTSLWQCETKHQHQNYAENRYKLVKRMTNRVMDNMGAPGFA